mgnify:CR=1 FL=1
MRNYDLSVLFSTTDGEEGAKNLFSKLEGVINKAGGKIYSSDFIGRIDLVNTFRKHTQAYSARIQYSTNDKGLAALSKEFKINEGIIRNLNTTLESVLSETEIAELVK